MIDLPDSDKKWRVRVPDEDYWREQIKCQHACPVNTDARGYVRAIAEGDIEKAYLIARGPNPLASICGRVCGAPCEAACRRGDIDQAVSIRALKRFVTERHGTESKKLKPLELLGRVLAHGQDRECRSGEELSSLRNLLRDLDAAPKSGKRVAIIGAGPAGLAAAHDLALLGIEPVVFEMEPIPAGMLVVGIPSYRLPRDLIEAEVELIQALGARFECNTEVGKEITLREIRNDFDATIIGVGLKRSRDLPLPGAEGSGVMGGVEFLREVALARPVELGRRVVVIGGGNVAYDISRTVVRQTGVDISRSALRLADVGEVHLVSLESLEELPADDLEIVEGDEEGVIRHHRWAPNRILRNESGKVQGVEFKGVTRVFDNEGRFAPEFDENVLTTLEADTVLWGIGQKPDLSFVGSNGDLPLNPRGLLDCDPETQATSASDVFLAGDIAHGPRLLIDAVASGKKVALSVHHSLTGKTTSARQIVLHLPILDYEREKDYEKQERLTIPSLSPEERKVSHTRVVETGYTPQMALCEAARCLDCGVNTIFDSEKCILCGGCADVCPQLCLRLVSLDTMQGDEDLDSALSRLVPSEERADTSAIIKDETQCIRCALCATRCPVDAITMERFQFDHTWMEVGA